MTKPAPRWVHKGETSRPDKRFKASAAPKKKKK